jgi:ABC-type lipoprotein export system ATPase subunit
MIHHQLLASHVSKSYIQGTDTIVVLHDISASFEQGKSYAITGISGSGKSTLIHLLAGLDIPSAGQIFFDGANIAQFSEDQKSRFLNKSIGLVFQYPYLIKELSVLENVMIKGLIGGIASDECARQAKELLANVGLSEKITAYPGQLSGGQQQRVALARALMNNPDFLLADEPTGNLDMQTGNAIIDLIVRLQKEREMGIIISSHDAYVTERMQMVYELQNGTLILK